MNSFNKIKTKHDDDYLCLLKVAYKFMQSIKPMEEGTLGNDSVGLCVKLFYHLSTLFHLRKGTNIDEKIEEGFLIGFVDHLSARVISRIAFENYLVIHTLFIDPSSTKEEKAFKMRVWEYSGIKSVISVSMNSEQGKIIKEKKGEDKKRLWNEIKQHSSYLELDTQKKGKVGNGNFPYESWHTLASKAEISKILFESFYSVASNYTHSGRHSVLKLLKSGDIENQITAFELALSFGLIVLALLIKSMKEMFPETNNLKLSENEMITVNKWIEISRKYPDF